jgi:rhamnosyltransferase subunit B
MPNSSHYLVISAGSTGDIHPFMSLAHALQALGRTVTFIAPSYHAALVQGAGLPFIGLGCDEEYRRNLANPDIWHPRKCFAALLGNYSTGLKQMDVAIRALDSVERKVIIAHPFAVPAAAIAREQGHIEAIVAVYLAPSNLKTCHDPLTIGPVSVPSWAPMSWRRAYWQFVEKGWIDPVAVSQINAVREPLGLPPVSSLLTHIAETPDLSVSLFPAWFAAAAPDWPSPLIMGDFPVFEASTHAELSAELTDFLANGEKPLVFTAGTANFHAKQFFAVAQAACHRLGRRAIFLTKDRTQITAQLPDSILWQAYVPLAALLPRAAAIIHHGGIGTTAEALRAGTPQLITPFAWDQFDNGARIAALGVGQVIPARKLHPRTLARSLNALCNSESIRAQCARQATHFDSPYDPVALCTEIEHALLQVVNSGGE